MGALDGRQGNQVPFTAHSGERLKYQIENFNGYFLEVVHGGGRMVYLRSGGRPMVPTVGVERPMVPFDAHPVPSTGSSHPPLWWGGGWTGRPAPGVARTTPGVVGILQRSVQSPSNSSLPGGGQNQKNTPTKRASPHTGSPLEALWWPPVRSGGIALWWLMHPARCRALWWLWPGGRRKEERGGPQAGSHAAAAATSRRHAPVEHLAPTPPRKAFKSQPEPPGT